jgi:hypothetical protein
MEEQTPVDNQETLGPELPNASRRAFTGLIKAWGLTEQEQIKLLGLPRSSELRRWKSGLSSTAINNDLLERVSVLLGIFAALNTLLPDPERADAWLRAPNAAPLFGGRRALDRMTSGAMSDLYLVRQYLDGQLG